MTEQHDQNCNRAAEIADELRRRMHASILTEISSSPLTLEEGGLSVLYDILDELAVGYARGKDRPQNLFSFESRRALPQGGRTVLRISADIEETVLP
jgi:hypothetical protein